MRTNIELDPELVDEATRLTGIRTRRELVDVALRELIRQRRKKDLADLAGRVAFYDGYDPKALREVRGDPGR